VRVRVWDFTRGCGRGRVWAYSAGAVAGGFFLHPTRTRPVAISSDAHNLAKTITCLNSDLDIDEQQHQRKDQASS
jgi:hypothetical protein